MRAGSGICATERKQKCVAKLRRIQSLWNIDMTYLMSDRNCERKQKCLKCYAEFSFFCGCKVGLTQVTNPGRLSTSRMRFHNILLLHFNQPTKSTYHYKYQHTARYLQQFKTFQDKAYREDKGIAKYSVKMRVLYYQW